MSINNESFLNTEAPSSDSGPPLAPEVSNVPESLMKSYRMQYESIIHTPLTPENITTYASDALNKYVGLLEDAHKEVGISTDDYSIETEKIIADRFLGLDSPWDVQAHIKSVQADIDRLAKRVTSSKVNRLPSYYVPPDDEGNPVIGPSNGSFEEATVTPRTITVLFLLEHNFGVNLDDPEEFVMDSGSIPDNAMRIEPYSRIEVKSQKRLILVCDQKGNRTFVFDTSRFAKLGLTADYVASLDKPEIDALLGEHPRLGASLYYSKNFMGNISDLIHSPTNPPKDKPRMTEDYNYLKFLPEKPEGYEFSTNLARDLGISESTLRSWLTNGKLGGEIQKFRRPGSLRGLIYAFSPEQQRIAARLKDEGERSASTTEKPEGYEFSTDFIRSLSIAESSLRNWIKAGKLGEVQQFYRPDAHIKRTYYALSPEQQEAVVNLKSATGEAVPHIPDDYEFLIDIVKSSNIPERTLRRWLMSGKLGGEAQEFVNQNSSTGRSYALSPEQREVAIGLREHLARLLEKPDDYEFLADFSNNSGISRDKLDYWLKSGKLGGNVQEFLNQRSRFGYSYALSPKQQVEALRLKA